MYTDITKKMQPSPSITRKMHLKQDATNTKSNI